MNHFQRAADGTLHAEGVPLTRIADEVGTPTYIYSRATLERHFRVFDEAWAGQPHLVCYAMKALSNLTVLNLLAKLGAGFDIVSAGELARVLKAGGDASKVVFSGVGKRRDEMAAALQAGIKCFNVESEAELDHLDEVARAHGAKAPVSLRINPDVDPQTHPYISTGLSKNKFGIPQTRARAAYARAGELEGLDVVGLDYHIGSQLAQVEPMVEACRRVLGLMTQLFEDGHAIEHLDVGGGLGITYRDEAPPSPAEYAATLKAELRAAGYQHLTILTEPGRVIVGNAGVMLMKVLLTKDNGVKRFAIVDAAMNDNIRPALYDAYQGLEPVAPVATSQRQVVDVVGPVCESGDFFARDRDLPPLDEGDLLVMRSSGAYGFVMASNYNSRPRPAEVLVDGDSYTVVRTRETIEDLWRGELIPE